jgi:L-ascorbate metabolism protein UlaG (beta-lactamase superfamily)
MKRILFKSFKLALILVGLLIITTVMFLNLSPQFGGKHSKEDKLRYEATGHYENGRFVNLSPANVDYSLSNMRGMVADMIKGNPNRIPKEPLPMEHRTAGELASNSQTRLIWFGHSAFLLQMNGMNILLDPMLGIAPSPVALSGPKRFENGLPIAIDDLPEIDIIFISHDHYDHLDYGSIQQLKHRTRIFFVPMGVGAHLRAWGIEDERIREMNWWEEAEHRGLQLAFAPMNHFSGRSIGDASCTMWGSWAIKGERNIFFSGDGGYGTHFKRIGERFGPFDMALMECGQYDKKWASVHLMPEESVQACIDVRAKWGMPIHWGAFPLAYHDWNDPVKRFTQEAERLGLDYTIPIIGQDIDLESPVMSTLSWW